MNIPLIGWGAAVLIFALEYFFPMVRGSRDWKRRWPLNLATTMVLYLAMGFFSISTIFVSGYCQKKGWGLFNHIQIPFAIMLIITILVRSWIGWILHVANHRVPILWRYHLCHHTDHFLDISTSGRFHLIETFIGISAANLGIIVLGLSPEATIIYEIIWIVWNNLSHANLRLHPYLERMLNWVIQTPMNHRAHHSKNPKDFNCNFGVVLSIWDRLYGTYKERIDGPVETWMSGTDTVSEEDGLSYVKVLVTGFSETKKEQGNSFANRKPS